MNILDFVWNGVSLLDETHFQEIQKSFLENLNALSTGGITIQNQIEKCSTELELILLIQPYFKWISIPQSSLTRFQKCAELSKKLRERANESYKTGNLSKAGRGYNLAIVFAPSDSPELGLAYGNRSALFFQIQKFSSSIEDIELALRNNFPENLQDKLLQRKEKCIEALRNLSGGGQTSAETSTLDTLEEIKSFCTDNFFTLQNEHKKIMNAEDWVEIDFNEERGRRLVATKNIPAATLILIDKPFVSVINNLLRWDLQHCHFCYKPLLHGIPCRICTFTMYCDEDCRLKSCEGSHKYEHNYLSYLQTISSSMISHRDLQALRLMSTVGPNELLKMHKNPDILAPSSKSNSNAQTQQQSISGFNNCQTYDTNSYQTMYHLISHGMNTSSDHKLSDTFKALFLTSLLKQCSSFFDKVSKSFKSSDNSSKSFEDFVTSLILRHIGNIRYNAISVSELKWNASGEEISVSFAAAIYPLISLCNHSCDPNAAPVKKFKFLETSLVTLKNLTAGDEICITYKPLFTQQKTRERQQFLKEGYNFLCNCNACQNNWCPKSIDSMKLDLETPSACSNCSSTKDGIVLKPCDDCLRSRLNTVAALEGFESQLHSADELIKKGDFKQAVEMLRPCLIYFSRNYSPCFLLSQVALDLFKRALVRLVNQAQEIS